MNKYFKIIQNQYDEICSPSSPLMDMTKEGRKFLFEAFRDSGLLTSLRYRGSRDGFTFKAFHSRCDLKGPTISLFKASNGDIIGGFTTA